MILRSISVIFLRPKPETVFFITLLFNKKKIKVRMGITFSHLFKEFQ